MKINQAFPSKYIKAADLQGKEYTLTVASVKIEDVGAEGSPEEKPVLYFAGRAKGVVLNRTNAETISHRYGDDTDDWINKEVIIYPDTVMFQGKLVDCIRMRVPATAAASYEAIPF